MPKFLVKDFSPWIPLPLILENDFEVEKIADQRLQFEKSFTDNLVGQLGAGYIKKSPWFAAFERGVNNLGWGAGKPVGRPNFVDKLFAIYPNVNKNALLEYLANTGDEWPTYTEHYKEMTGIYWPHGNIDVEAILKQMISWAFDCQEHQVPRYYGIGYGGPLTADMTCSKFMSEKTKEDALVILSNLKRNKDQQFKALGGVENFRMLRNELRHRVGHLDYLEHVAKVGNDQSAEDDNGYHAVMPGPVGYEGRAPGNAEAVMQKQEPLVGYERRLSGYAENKAETSELVIGYQGRKSIETAQKNFAPEDKTFGSIVSIDHNNISRLVMILLNGENLEDVRVLGSARGSYNFVYFIKVGGVLPMERKWC